MNKKINANSLEFEGVKASDYPDFTDAFVVYAEYEDGTELTEAEIEEIDISDYYDEMYQSLIP